MTLFKAVLVGWLVDSFAVGCAYLITRMPQ